MDENHPTNAASGQQQKKPQQLDDLSREELITKSKNLLLIAKKAKASKDEALEEIKRLKEDAAKFEELRKSDKTSLDALQELVESLTQNKLVDATKLEDLTKQILSKDKSLKDLQKQLASCSEISIENEGLKRQVKRLSDENDDLLAQMQAFDSKSADLGSDDVKEQIEKLRQDLLEATKQNEEKSRENKSLQSLIDNNSSKIKKIIQENAELKEILETRDDATSTDQVKIKYDKCIKKLKLYREKICDISEKFQLLKADREVLISTTREYSDSVSNWQKEIAKASIKMIERIRESHEDLKSKKEEIENLKKEISNQKLSSDAVKSCESQIKILEAEIQKLNEVLQSKDKTIAEEREAQKKLKQTSKNKSLLDLEMEAYEKTLNELNKKLEAKKLQVTEFENAVKMQSDTMESLRSQISSLEASLNSEKAHSADIKKNLDVQLDLLRKTEHERTEANLQLEIINKNYEALKLENVEVKLEASQHVGDIEKKYHVLESERNELLRNISQLENDVDKFKKLSASHENEIESLRTEFASYKIRAQGVLRQSQTKDLSREQELQDEVVSLQKSLENFKDANSKVSTELESLKKNFSDIAEDKVHLQGRCKDLLEALEKQSDEVLEETRKRNQQHDEAIKAYQLQIDTLNTFYKKKLQEAEETGSARISGLQSKISQLEKSQTFTPLQTAVGAFEQSVYQMRNDEPKLSLTLLDREEAEGSEDQSSQSSTFQLPHRRKISKGRELMPLDELLNASFDDNSNEVQDETNSNFSLASDILEHTKVKLAKEENRVQHLTVLLADSEKDLARMQQMNDMLKEEVRRQQRNFDREEHIQNSEYLKNIVIKFITLNNGDEKQRLIPVINTILKLSSEENNLLQNACKSAWWSK